MHEGVIPALYIGPPMIPGRTSDQNGTKKTPQPNPTHHKTSLPPSLLPKPMYNTRVHEYTIQHNTIQMKPQNSLLPSLLNLILTLLLLPPIILLFCNLALITTLLSSFVLSLRALSVYFDVGIAVLTERWRGSSSGRTHRVRGGSGGEEGLGRGRRSESVRRGLAGLWEEEEEMAVPVGRVNYATLIRPLEPASGWGEE